MKPENAIYLERNKSIYEIYARAQYISAMTTDIRAKFLDILHEEFSPGYTVDFWCGHCVAKMVVDLYKYYYDWKAKNQTEALERLKKQYPDLNIGKVQ